MTAVSETSTGVVATWEQVNVRPADIFAEEKELPKGSIVVAPMDAGSTIAYTNYVPADRYKSAQENFTRLNAQRWRAIDLLEKWFNDGVRDGEDEFEITLDSINELLVALGGSQLQKCREFTFSATITFELNGTVQAAHDDEAADKVQEFLDSIDTIDYGYEDGVEVSGDSVISTDVDEVQES